MLAGGEVARVVAAQCIAQSRLWIRPGSTSLARSAETFRQDDLHRTQVGAGPKSLLNRQVQPPEVALVDLPETDAVVPAGGVQRSGGGQRLSKAARLAHQCAAHDANGKRIARALHSDQGLRGVGRHQRCAGGDQR